MTDCTVHIRDNSNGVAHVITSHDLLPDIDNNNYMSILKSITKNSLLNETTSDIYQWHEEISKHNIKTLCDLLIDKNYTYVFFWFEGNQLIGDIDYDFLEWAKLRTQDWDIMGHILKWQDKRPKLHEQVVVLNLKNLPDFTKAGPNKNYIVSKENMHDDYTPVWIRGCEGNNTDTKNYNHVFDEILNNILSHNGRAVNVPDILRDCKQCFYADADQEQTVQWLLDENFYKLPQEKKEQFIFDELDEDKQELGVYLLQEDVVFVSNPDSIPTEVFEEPKQKIETLVAPASGVNGLILAMHYSNTLEKVVWFDFSKPAIKWIQHVLQNWNGKNYKNFYVTNKTLLSTWCKDENLIWADDAQLNDIDEYFDSIENSKWQQLKNKKHVFLNADIVSEYSDILEHVQNTNVLLYFTNIYTYSLNFILNKYHVVHSNYSNMISEFTKNNKNVYFRGISPTGRKFKSIVNLSRTGDI